MIYLDPPIGGEAAIIKNRPAQTLAELGLKDSRGIKMACGEIKVYGDDKMGPQREWSMMRGIFQEARF